MTNMQFLWAFIPSVLLAFLLGVVTGGAFCGNRDKSPRG